VKNLNANAAMSSSRASASIEPDNGRLQKFMLAAPAAAIAAVAASSEAHAQIVVYPISPSLVATTSNNVYIGNISLTGYAHNGNFPNLFLGLEFSKPNKPYANGNGGLGLAVNGSNYVLMLTGGATIGSSLSFTGGNGGNTSMAYHGTGPWAAGSGGVPTYIGLALSNGSGDYNYGWADVSYNTSGTLTFSEFAFNTALDQPIAAGDTGLSAVPEPANTVLLIAAGAAGFALYRARKARSSQAA
jgi:hypothetical protein